MRLKPSSDADLPALKSAQAMMVEIVDGPPEFVDLTVVADMVP